VRKTRGALALALVVALAFGIAACGDDDDDDATAGDGTGQVAGGNFEEFCEAALALENPPEPEIADDASPEEQRDAAKAWAKETLRPRMDKVAELAPEELSDEVAVYDKAVADLENTGDFESAFESDAIEQADRTGDPVVLETCGWAETDVEAVEYSFRGVPAELKAGVHSFRLTNGGKEMHELIVFRKKAETTESFDELLALPQEEAEQKADFVGATFAPPGERENAVMDLEAGEYAAVCFIPVGSTPEAGEDVDGPPHFTRGMKVEFRVA
jgi:hypothetical protein